MTTNNPFFHPSGLELLRYFVVSCSVFDDARAKAILNAHYQSRVPSKSEGRHWRSKCNSTTALHLKQLVDDGTVVCSDAFDAATAIPLRNEFPFYAGSPDVRPPVAEISDAYRQDMNNRRKKAIQLFLRPDTANVLEALWASQGSELVTAQLGLSSVFLSFFCSSDPKKRDIAKTWTSEAIPASQDEYLDSYVGDAYVTIDKTRVAICCLFVPEWWDRDIRRLESFLEAFHRRIDCPYRIYSPLQFQQFSKKKDASWLTTSEK